jgi:hypothetical protein
MPRGETLPFHCWQFGLLVAGMYPILPEEYLRHWRRTVPNEILPRQDKP